MLIVAREQPQVYDYLKQVFSAVEKVEVILDRRRGERRRRNEPHEPERRQGQRRRDPGSHPRSDWFVFVRRPTD
jgi:hypothetical protein